VLVQAMGEVQPSHRSLSGLWIELQKGPRHGGNLIGSSNRSIRSFGQVTPASNDCAGEQSARRVQSDWTLAVDVPASSPMVSPTDIGSRS
jgi:hypothetical protein